MLLRKLKSIKRWITGIVSRKLAAVKHDRRLAPMRDMVDFERYVREVEPALFLRYRGLSEEKRLDFASAIDHLGIDMTGLSFLDIGPAHGDSLDVAHERGAARVEFTEYDAFFYTYNRLKPYANGYRIDHRRQLGALPAAAYDVIWCKGGIAGDYYIRFRTIASLSAWLDSVERLARPGAHVLICPGWTNDGTRRNIEDLNDNLFTRTMLDRGYRMLPPVPHHNHEPDYPVTYHLRVPGGASPSPAAVAESVGA